MKQKFAWLVFALVFGWKVALYVFTAQPVPANDGFFYDSAVIHHLLHGGYYSPYIAGAFPVSGAEIFSVYPPGYQLPLLLWMKVFGTSAMSAMGLHLCLFGLYMLALLAIFRRLQVPAWCVNLTGGFLLIFTFHDRPDSFAHLLGILAVYACVRSRRLLGRGTAPNAGPWLWLMILFIVLAVGTSLQIGGIYFLVVSLATLAACRVDREPVPFLPMSLMVIVPVCLVGLVIACLPRAWAGFMENARQTPFLTGLRMPHPGEVLKIVRTVPGIFVISALLPLEWLKRRGDFATDSGRRYGVILLAALLPALGIMAASLSILAPNTVAISSYLQPVIVAAYLGLIATSGMEKTRVRMQAWCLVPAIVLCSVRTVGMTTWGAACAQDVSYRQANALVEDALAAQPAGSKVVMSSAFLYGAAKHGELDLIHGDWMVRANGNSEITDTQGLVALKPGKMILTQFDYYRRFEKVLDRLRSTGRVEITVTNTAHIRAPDSYPSIQQVVQNISWAPVIVTFSWPSGK